MKKLLFVVFSVFVMLQAQAAIISFDLRGKAGNGLLNGNENPAVTGGTGGEIGTGISFNDATLVLSIDVGWGSANGFMDLSGNTILGHLHGPTLDGGTAAFTENAGVKYTLHTLPQWNNSASSGGFNGSISILPGDVPALLNGQFYFNAHTTLNSGGEIRGNLVVVPEPSAVGLSILGLGAILVWRRRRAS